MEREDDVCRQGGRYRINKRDICVYSYTALVLERSVVYCDRDRKARWYMFVS